MQRGLVTCAGSIFLILLAARGYGVEVEPADLVFRGGKIVTLDPKKPEAQALAARGERIIAVGTNNEIKPLIGPRTRVIDLQGKLAVPGFIEGHGHLCGLGDALQTLDLSKARDWDEVITLVAEAAKKAGPGEWIVGRGWHQGKWNKPPLPHVQGYPTHAALSQVTPQNPVLLTHGTGHMSFANAKALELAGIGRKTPDPKGGEILRDENGNPTGALRETAQNAVQRAHERAEGTRTPEKEDADALQEIALATRECLSRGITTFQDAGSSFATIDRFKRLADAGKLDLRLWVMVRNENLARLKEKLADYRMIGYGNNRLTVRAIKRMIDGAIGSHGAWFLEPYHDLPSRTGLAVESVDQIREVALLAVKHDFQLCTHAIGDRANREVLDLYQIIFRSHPDKRDWRWRIEHAQHIHPTDIPRFSELKVIASMQANHATSDGPFVVARLGRKRGGEESYAWRSLLDTGAVVINGTDAPVETVDPLDSFYASVTRRMRDGTQFFPEQCMTRAEALKSYTLDAAYAGFEEEIKGSLSPGKLADVAVLSRDILTVPAEEIRAARVVYTVLGGRVVYERP